MDDVIQTVSFGVIAYNEHRYLPELLDDLLLQTYSKNLIEVILVDGKSDDDTLEIMLVFQREHSGEYRNIKVLENSRRVQPAGWNVVIRNSTADALLRIDAHARLPKDFIAKNVVCLNSGESVCGGPRENIIDENTPWKSMLLTAEQSMFGAGIASYRQGTGEKKYVKSLFHGAYRRDVLNNVGLFNEGLIRTEDNEYHYRVRKAGYRICYDPGIRSFYQTRNSLKGMLRQKFQNGLWIGKTLFVCPGCISLFHLVPFAFVGAVILTAILAALGVFWPAVVLWAAYCVANLGMTLMAVFSTERKNPAFLLLPVVFLLLHVCYGTGTFLGILQRR